MSGGGSLSGAEGGETAAAHHLLELGEVDHAVAVGVHPAYHAPAVLQGAALLEAEGGEDGPELLHGDEAVAVLIEDVERLPHVLLLVPLVHDGLVELPELVEVDVAVAVGVYLLDHGGEVGVGDVDAEVGERVGELAAADPAIAIAVEHLEDAVELRRVHGEEVVVVGLVWLEKKKVEVGRG